MIKHLAASLVALSLTAAPVAANAAPMRAAAPVSPARSNLFGEEGGGLILALIILAGTLYVILEQEDDEETPDSP